MLSLRSWLGGNRRREALTAKQLGSGFRALYECESLGIATLSPSGRFLSANKALQRMLGYDERELAARTFDDVTYPEDIPACAVLFERLQRLEIDHFEMEKRYIRKDGELIWTNIVVAGVRENGRLLHTIGVAKDITPRKRAEESVRRLTADLEERVQARTAQLAYHTALLAAVQDASPDGFAIIDHERGRLITCNQRFVEMWGLTAGIVASGSLKRILEHILPQLTAPERERAALEMKEFEVDREKRLEDEAALSDGRIYEFYSCPINSADGQYYGRVSYWHDVTRRARAERELRKTSEVLSRSNADLDLFAAAAAHDLSAPLRRIIGFGDLLREKMRGRLDAESESLLARMQNAAAGMSKLVADVLELSRVGREAPPLETVDLGLLAAEVVAIEQREIAETGASVSVGPLPTVRAHSSLLRGVLQNLIGNALKYRRPGAPPRVRVESRSGAKGFVTIAVSDNGVGFAQKEAERIFEPFVRLNAAGGRPGSGIGLAICRRIAERYGGRISAVSEPDKGAVFTLELPVSMLAPPGNA